MARCLLNVRFPPKRPYSRHTRQVRVRQLVLVDEGHLCVLRLRRVREDAAERQGGDKQRTKDAFHGALSSGWRMRDQAAARERRNHSSKAMRPRRASPNGTSERSSTRPPKYRASGSLTTTPGAPPASRYRAT